MIDDGARERNLPGTVLVVPRYRSRRSSVPNDAFPGARNFPTSE